MKNAIEFMKFEYSQPNLIGELFEVPIVIYTLDFIL